MLKAAFLCSAILASAWVGAAGCSANDDVVFGECATNADCDSGAVCSSERTCVRPTAPTSGSSDPPAATAPSDSGSPAQSDNDGDDDEDEGGAGKDDDDKDKEKDES